MDGTRQEQNAAPGGTADGSAPDGVAADGARPEPGAAAGGAAPAGRRVTVVGEVLVDLLWRAGAREVLPVPGGSPANVAVGLRRLGCPATLVTAWGDDPPGELVAAHLSGTGLDVRRAPTTSGRTTVALAHVDRTGSATYDFIAAWDPRELPVPPDTAVLHTGSLATVVEPGADRVLEVCRWLHGSPGRTVAADLNVRPGVQPDRTAYREACLRLATVTDVLKASDEDLAWLYPAVPAEEAARTLLAAGPRIVVVTRGARGALAVTAGTRAEVPAPPVDVVDTVGAGDAFQAALLDAVASGAPLTTAGEITAVLNRCTAAAALACARPGADPPTRAALDAVTG
ncbi:carbohydrate kinase [Streptomyces sp. TRM 70351]|uniref:carbohydrate kinase family protein n=1 Tax=Streptomyces sp. TRM 70351 TaxID=3116552 RepID=UPI002E7B5DA1|nr:carbohydrate kinase [Streptomyces sp. TRM 70351]MEE1930207.1 carbohydrate kinase [Streptomyces sp. TRM 70351]